MTFIVNVPLGEPLGFPDRCPFTSKPSPKGKVRLKKTSTSIVIPVPFGFFNSYAQTSLRLPADKSFALTALFLELMICSCLLGGIGICIYLLTRDMGKMQIIPAFFLLGGPVLAWIFRIARFWITRPVRIDNAWSGFVEVHFKSESYAREFAEMNRLSVVDLAF